MEILSSRDLWAHQEEAKAAFLKAKHGILEMATGTGKTRTAIGIIKKLLEEGKVRRVIVITYGTDLLQQWYHELLLNLGNIKIFRFFDKYKEGAKFSLSRGNSLLILSRDAERIAECLSMLEKRDGQEQAWEKTLLLFDEVHGLGAVSFERILKGRIQRYRYRLGLSATPKRDYDDQGNEFIQNEIGDVIYRFGLEEAIQNGILCPFSYIPLSYELTDRERERKRAVIAAYEMKRSKGIHFEESDMYRDLARVNKTAEQKIPQFDMLIKEKPDLLEHCILFVETMEYGIHVQNMLIRHNCRFHTYYGEDTKDNLRKFGSGQIDCLLTCKKISEGIDIRSARNIVLFSSDKGKIVTIQRIGRVLRKNPEEPSKKACVVDFICRGESGEDTTTDQERREWLTKLAKVGNE